MDEIDQYFEILGLNSNASLGEVKQSYRDLVKVWHPDRFSHDPRLQQKAQEKLKEINVAYEYIQSFLTKGYRPGPRRHQRSSNSHPREPSTPPKSPPKPPNSSSAAYEETFYRICPFCKTNFVTNIPQKVFCSAACQLGRPKQNVSDDVYDPQPKLSFAEWLESPIKNIGRAPSWVWWLLFFLIYSLIKLYRYTK